MELTEGHFSPATWWLRVFSYVSFRNMLVMASHVSLSEDVCRYLSDQLVMSVDDVDHRRSLLGLTTLSWYSANIYPQACTQL